MGMVIGNFTFGRVSVYWIQALLAWRWLVCTVLHISILLIMTGMNEYNQSTLQLILSIRFSILTSMSVPGILNPTASLLYRKEGPARKNRVQSSGEPACPSLGSSRQMMPIRYQRLSDERESSQNQRKNA